MAVLCNNVIAGASIADDAAGDAYQIEKSLRFNSADTAKLTRTPGSEGNRKIWTWSGWVKRTKLGADECFFSAGTGNTITTLRFREGGSNPDNLYVFHYDSGFAWDLSTDAEFRDTSAWYHIVVAYDSTQSVEEDRVKLYVNGKHYPKSVLNATNYPSQNLDARICDDHVHTVGTNGDAANYFNGYISDVYLIDGLQLSPAAFGSFDSNTGVWNPKAFARPAPNQNVTHSSTMVSSTGSWYSASYNNTRAFNGLGTSGTGTSPDSATASCTWTPATPIAFTQGVATHNNACVVDLTLTDGTTDEVITVSTAHATTTLYEGNSQIKSIKWTPIGSVYTDVQEIWVDGVMLVDGQTDPTTRNNPNNGTEWSSGTATGTLHGAWANLFNGLTDGTDVAASGNSGASAELTLPSSISWTKKLRVLSWIDHADCKLELTIDGTTTDYADLYNASNQWKTISTTAGSLTKIKLTSQSGTNERARVSAIEVDGHVVIDSSVDNSFHLKFNDTSTNAALGKTSDVGVRKIADATGGLPIYNTTDDWGEVKGSGYRADSSAGTTDGTGLVLAVPGDSIASGTADVHQQINTGSSNKAVTVGNDAVVSTADSKLYGSSLYFDGTNDYLSFPNSSDFTFGSGNFTVECWVKPNGTPAANNGIMGQWDHANDQRCWLIQTTTGNIFRGLVNINGTVGGNTILTGTKIVTPGQWHHLAFVRNSNTLSIYVDGVLDNSTSFSGTVLTPSDPVLIGSTSVSSYSYKGWLNDARIYKGVAKYTSNFIPPTRNDFTVNNLVASIASPGFEFGLNKDNYTFDQNSTSVTYDVTGGNIDSWSDMTSPKVVDPGDPPGLAGGENQNSLRVYRTKDGSKRVWTITLNHSGGSESAYVYTSDNGVNWVSPSGVQDCSSGYSTPAAVYMTHSGGAWDDSSTAWTETGDPVEVDALVDTPTNYGTDTGAGGEARGNYFTWNSIDDVGNNITLTQGNLTYQAPAAIYSMRGTFAPTKGKWYFEVTITGAVNTMIGVELYKDSTELTNTHGNNTERWSLGVMGDANNGKALHNNSSTDVLFTPALNDTIGCALDLDNQKIWWSRNGTWNNIGGSSLGNPATGANPVFSNVDPGTYGIGPSVHGGSNSSKIEHWNFGQRAFKYTAPSGFKSLCTQNLDDIFSGDELNNPSKYFDVKTYTGNGATNSVKGVGFQPELIWVKSRSNAYDHLLFDRVRSDAGNIYNYLKSNDDGGQATGGTTALTAYNSDGFTMGADGAMNTSDATFVAWMWDTGTAAVTPSTDGSLTLLAQWKNATAGFSMSTWDGTGSNATVGHGLGVPPEFIIVKLYNGQNEWAVYHKDLGPTLFITLEDSDDSEDNHEIWNDTSPTNTVYSISTSSRVNGSGHKYIGYAWTSIPGYSAFGSFTGNGAAQGPFNYTGFRPKWVLLKRDGSAYWQIHDTERSTYNGLAKTLFPNANAVESTDYPLDIVSNGFLTRNAGGNIQYYNNANDKILWAAFAETPFKIARAR